MIDWKVRKTISKIRILAAAIKYYFGINHYSQRDHDINNGIVMNECLRYSQKELWKNVIQYSETRYARVKFILELYKELKAAQTD